MKAETPKAGSPVLSRSFDLFKKESDMSAHCPEIIICQFLNLTYLFITYLLNIFVAPSTICRISHFRLHKHK